MVSSCIHPSAESAVSASGGNWTWAETTASSSTHPASSAGHLSQKHRTDGHGYTNESFGGEHLLLPAKLALSLKRRKDFVRALFATFSYQVVIFS